MRRLLLLLVPLVSLLFGSSLLLVQLTCQLSRYRTLWSGPSITAGLINTTHD